MEYRTKEDALKILKKRWGESSYLLDSLGQNPLPNSVLITVESLESAGEVTDFVSGFDGIEDIKYYKETVEKLSGRYYHRNIRFVGFSGDYLLALQQSSGAYRYAGYDDSVIAACAGGVSGGKPDLYLFSHGR